MDINMYSFYYKTQLKPCNKNMNIELFINKYTPRGVEFSGEEVIVLPLVSIASLFVVELRSRLPLNGCM